MTNNDRKQIASIISAFGGVCYLFLLWLLSDRVIAFAESLTEGELLIFRIIFGASIVIMVFILPIVSYARSLD